WELTGKGDADIGVSLPRTPFARQRIIDDVLRLASLKAAYRLRPGTLRVAGKDGKRTVVQYKSLALNATIKGAGQGGGHDDFAFAANAALDLDAAPDGWALSGKLGGRLLLDFGLGRLRLERTALGVQYKGKGLPAADAVAVLTADADFDLDAERLSLADLTAEATGAKAGGQLRGEKIFSDDRVVTGRLAASAANLARVLRTWGVDPGEPRDPGVYKSPRLEADVALRGRDLDCTRLTAGLDDFSVKGALRLADWGRGRITFDLTGGALDADRFRAKPGKAAARAMKDGRCTDNSEPPRPLPLELLRALNMHGALKMERLRFFGIRHRNLAATLDAAGGRLTLEPVSAGFYGGSMDAGLVVVVGPKALEMDLDLMADDFETGEFLQDQMDRDYVRGVSDVTLDFTARGATDEDLLNTLKGTAAFTVRNGSYRFLGGRQDPAKESRSKFSLARATFAAQNGRFEVTNFLLDSTLMRGTGGGYFDLAQNLIDLKLNAEYLAAPTVPILIRGCLTDPGVSVPGDKILENTVKEVISIPLKPFQYLQRLIF
ncbi:MAG: AsmA-like C-terminal region-containing protein, partial [Desulfovibrionaceae bacterium]